MEWETENRPVSDCVEILFVGSMTDEDLDLGEDGGVLKPCSGLNLDPLCSHLHAGDRGLGSLGFSPVQCIRKAAVVLSARQKHRRSLKQPKKKESFHRIFCLTAQAVVYDTSGTHKTSYSQTISHPCCLCHYRNINQIDFRESRHCS